MHCSDRRVSASRFAPLSARHRASFLSVLVGLVFLAATPLARAVLPDEIQVYVDDLNDPGELSVQLHVNTTPSGRSQPDYPGEITPAHGLRVTPEFAYGLTPSLEAGLYVPATRANGSLYLAGLKLRLKWVPVKPPDDGDGWFAGLNGELSQVGARFEEERRGFELRPILGWHDRDWLLAVNPVLAFPLAGNDRHQSPDFAPSAKIARTVAEGVGVGVEYYADLGPLPDSNPGPEQDHTLYFAIDLDRKPWVLNFGVGRGLNSETDRWTIKAIITIPIGG
jgi:hypothetical protein